MATAVLQTRVDARIKEEADCLFSSLGLDTTTAIRLFLKQAINQQKIPFEILHSRPASSLPGNGAWTFPAWKKWGKVAKGHSFGNTI